MQDAIKIIKKLKNNGFEAYLVGGVVRDYLLGITPNDIDITTNAHPEQVMSLFRSFPSGLKFGSVTVVMNKKNYEVTTYRLDFDYKDSRRPEKIKFAASAREDVMRRDFTVNALLMNEQMEITDYVSGLDDLKLKILRAVGNPKERFAEDALRILRAVRFVSKLGFSIEEKTSDAIKSSSANLLNLASERILQELQKIERGKYFLQALRVLKNLEIINHLTYLKAGVNYYLENNYNMPSYFITVSGALDTNLKNQLRLPRTTIHQIEKLAELINNKPQITSYLIYCYGVETITLYNDYLVNTNHEYGLDTDKLNSIIKKIAINSRKDLLITNDKIIQLVDKPTGPWVKEYENKILQKVLNDGYPNQKDELIKLVKEIIKSDIPRK